jgi:hypothetical protein
MSTWIDALKKYSETTGKFVVPRRGTMEYDNVMRIKLGVTDTPVEGGAYSANSVRCTDKNIRIGTRGTAGACFKKGLSVGYKAGISKQQPQAPQAPQRPDLEGMNLRALGDLASRSGIRGYSRMTKQELYSKLLELYPL